MRVLLADAGPTNRRRLREVLGEIGAEAIEAETPEAGLALVERCAVDAVIMDFPSPGSTRFPIWRSMRLAAAASDVLFVIYVGHRLPWMRDEQLSASADAVLDLPIGAADLIEALIGVPA